MFWGESETRHRLALKQDTKKKKKKKTGAVHRPAEGDAQLLVRVCANI